MKQNIFRKLMLIAVLLTGSHAFAHDFEVDGIYYNILSEEDKTVEVTYGDTKYSGSIIISESVMYESNTYSVTSIDHSAFEDCSDLTSITISNSITSIGESVFGGCTGLTSVTIPNSVISIGDFAFWKCTGLTSITISNSIISIGEGAFSGCTGLTKIICKNVTPAAAYYNTFNLVPTTATLYVPIGAKEAYANATGWNYFTNIVENDEISGLENTLTDNDVNVSVENGNIVIGGTDNANIEVYSVNGQCVYSGNATSIPMTAKGLYIVKVNGKSFKVML